MKVYEQPQLQSDATTCLDIPDDGKSAYGTPGIGESNPNKYETRNAEKGLNGLLENIKYAIKCFR